MRNARCEGHCLQADPLQRITTTNGDNSPVVLNQFGEKMVHFFILMNDQLEAIDLTNGGNVDPVRYRAADSAIRMA